MKSLLTPMYTFMASLSVLFIPSVSHAATLTCPAPGQIENLTDLINFVTCALNQSVLPLLVTLAVVFFLWGVTQYMINPASSEEREKGQQYMIWGLIGLFVVVSVWGLVSILTSTFGLEILIPQLQD